MRVAAFLQLYNESSNGHLIRCLTNCAIWADEIFIYDDGSTDDSREIYLDFTEKSNIIFGEKNDFKGEIAHKQQLLELVLKSNPDWIGWIDGDDSLDRRLTFGIRDYIEEWQIDGLDGVYLHNRNLWKTPCYYRVDNHFDDLWKVNFWRNNGQLHYADTSPGLHRPQHPDGLTMIGRYMDEPGLNLLHYGFSTVEGIVSKYLTYKGHGQTGWELQRLVNEVDSYELKKTPKEWFPLGQLPHNWDTCEPPKAQTYNEYRRFKSLEEYKESLK